jgi:hypothetical protein
VFIAAKKRKSLLDLAGKIELAPGYDYKSLRAAAMPSSVHEPHRPARGRSRRSPKKPGPEDDASS